jgi:hypothetical protein
MTNEKARWMALGLVLGMAACGETVTLGGGVATDSAVSVGAGGRSAAEIGCVAGALETFAPVQYLMQAIASDDLYLYWANAVYQQSEWQTEIVRASKADGSVVVLDTRPAKVAQILVDEANVYWLAALPGALESDQLMAVPKDGGVAVALYTADGVFDFTAGDPDRLFVLQPHAYPPSVSLHAVPKAGGATVDLLSEAATMGFALAEDETRLYWWEEAAGRIVSMAKAGGVPQVLAEVPTEGVHVPRILVDAQNVYWAVTVAGSSMGSSRIFRVAKGGGSVTMLAEEPLPSTNASLLDMAIDDRCLYWTELTAELSPQTGLAIGQVRAMRKDDGSTAVVVEHDNPAASALIADQSGLYLIAGGSNEVLSGFTDPPLAGVQRIPR